MLFVIQRHGQSDRPACIPFCWRGSIHLSGRGRSFDIQRRSGPHRRWHVGGRQGGWERRVFRRQFRGGYGHFGRGVGTCFKGGQHRRKRIHYRRTTAVAIHNDIGFTSLLWRTCVQLCRNRVFSAHHRRHQLLISCCGRKERATPSQGIRDDRRKVKDRLWRRVQSLLIVHGATIQERNFILDVCSR